MAEENENIILEEGTYEIIQNRLKKEGKDLTGRLLKLNQARKEVFGAIETKLLATERVTTKNNCVARDIIMLGDTFLFGYNVHMGLKSEMKLSDVFSAYTYKDNAFHETSLKFVEDKKFVDDFLNLYKYYRDTQFVKFAQIGVNIFMVFQVGKTEDDIKTFKWTLVNGKLKYIDNRSDHEFKFPNQHEFKWQKPKREQFRSGRHPHISIEDRIFVETVGGDLTIKIEDNTDSGLGIYSEPVNEKDQNLGDAAIQYAIIENLIILKIKPYKEDDFRYIVYNEKIEKAVRIDALENSCIFLPDNQGIIFSKGYYAQTGEFKLFDNQQEDMIFEKRIVSQNGEDYLFTFYNNSSGTYILLPYNLIEQSVGTPIVCHGFTLLENGELLYFKGDDDQKKHHAIQIWQTPFIGPDFELKGKQDSYLFKLGNKEIVKAMAECRDVIKLIEKDDSYNNLYIDLVKKSTDIIDTYHWLTHKDAFELRKPLEDIKGTSNSAISEFEKVVQIKKSTKKQTSETLQKAEDIISKIKRSTFEHIDEFVNLLSELRVIRGEVISLKELRYVELDVVNQTEETLGAQVEGISENCIQFLLQDESLKPYEGKVATLRKEIEGVSKNADAELIAENISDTSKELEMLIEIVSNLKITDPTKTTEIVDHIGSIYAEFNQVNSILKQKRKELFSLEGRAEFNAQIKLISQGVVNYLDVSDSPEKCEEYLNKLMIQLEELEGKFSEFEEFTDLIHDKREEIYNAFESRKLTLVEEINRKTTALSNSADRILKGIHHKLSELMTVSEINGYYASDIMVDKVRDIVKRLMDLGDSVKADRIQSQLKSAKEEALRQLKDKNELYLNGQDIVKFGKHQFTYNKQKLDLTMVLKDSDMYYHLSGTDFFEKVNDLDFNGTKEVWGQTLTSENQDIYRAEYLAHTLLSDLENEKIQWKGQIARISTLLTLTPKELLGLIQTYAQPKYSEGYVKGVHDHDASMILTALLNLIHNADHLRYSSVSRACARFYWKYQLDQEEQQKIHARFKGIGEIIRLFPDTKMFDDLIEEIQNKIVLWNDNKRLFDLEGIDEAGVYLIHEIATRDYFVLSHESAQLLDKFTSFLKKKKEWNAFSNSIKKLDPIAQFKLIVKWLKAFIIDENVHDYWGLIEESAVQLMVGAIHEDHIIHVPMTLKLEGLLGTHDIIEGGNYQLNFHQFSNRLKQFERINVPMYAQYMKRKHQLTDDFKEELRLSEFMPKVMSSFVRNKLIDEVYLNVIGDNLAKQIGSAGENKRTDLMGMLLLISPPGYGKTTLMEYIANRLGIIFMKINGPAIGHQVTSLDPESANNSAAKEELEKLNLAFEMGDNVMIYLDDIQHCNPEFLQKFISLCDAQRKVEGVYKGRSKTYDLKGKKVCVVMAGNPYTESGEKFQIPDMLANRSDIYNLGDVIGDNETTFKLSYIENALTSNPILARLANKSFEDVYTFIQWAETGTKEGLDFEVSHSAEEANEYVNLLKKLLVVREVIYKVNQQYIYSAAQSDAYRTEPAFKLQGSYRNMNKIAEKLLPVMNEHELNTLILSHYENESQTLTNGAEANMLKFKELIGKLSGQELERWNTIKLKFQKNQQLKGFGESNSMGQMLLKVEDVNASLGGIQQALTQAVQGRPASVNKIGVNKQSEALEELVQALGSQSESLKAMTNHSDQRFESLMKQLIKVAENFQKPKELDDPNVDLRNNKELKKLHKALRIDVIEKGFITEQLNEYFSYGFEFHNLGKVNIQSFSGIVEFYNAKKEKLYEMDIYYKDGVPAGQSVECSTKSIYNSFSEKDNVFKEAYLDQLEVIWLPRSIEFEKGKAKAQKKSSEL